jgi:hypothetical protein
MNYLFSAELHCMVFYAVSWTFVVLTCLDISLRLYLVNLMQLHFVLCANYENKWTAKFYIVDSWLLLALPEGSKHCFFLLALRIGHWRCTDQTKIRSSTCIINKSNGKWRVASVCLLVQQTVLICGLADSRKIIVATLVSHGVGPSCVVSEVMYKRPHLPASVSQ